MLGVKKDSIHCILLQYRITESIRFKCYVQSFFKHLQGHDFTTSPGNPFQYIITFFAKKYFLISNLNLLWCILRLCLFLSLVTWEKRPTLTWTPPPFRQLQTAIRSLLSLLFTKINISYLQHTYCCKHVKVPESLANNDRDEWLKSSIYHGVHILRTNYINIKTFPE